MRTGDCERCGEAFVDGSRAQNRRFCSENCRKRANDDGHRATCIDCGVPMSARTGYLRRTRPYERCRPCEDARRYEGLLARGREVEQWWCEGLTYREIPEKLGWGSNSRPGVLITRLRKEGFDLPYRYPKVAERNATQEAA